MINELFAVHRLNAGGLAAADRLAAAFTACASAVESEFGDGVGGRELALVRTKLQEASFFAKRGMAMQPGYQAPPEDWPAHLPPDPHAKGSP